MRIPTENVVPSVLHIFLGLVTDFFRSLEEFANHIDPTLPARIDELLQRHNIVRNAWFQMFVGTFDFSVKKFINLGNHLHKLIGSSLIINQIREIVPHEHALFPTIDYILNILRTLGKIQRFAKSEFMDAMSLLEMDAEIEVLRNLILQVDFIGWKLK